MTAAASAVSDRRRCARRQLSTAPTRRASSDLRHVRKYPDCRGGAGTARSAARPRRGHSTRSRGRNRSPSRRRAIDFVKLKTRSPIASAAWRCGWCGYASFANVRTWKAAIASLSRGKSPTAWTSPQIAIRPAIASHDVAIARLDPPRALLCRITENCSRLPSRIIVRAFLAIRLDVPTLTAQRSARDVPQRANFIVAGSQNNPQDQGVPGETYARRDLVPHEVTLKVR
jgi:hypothetical protein